MAGGHTTKTPSPITYSSVAARDPVRIALTIAALYGLSILSFLTAVKHDGSKYYEVFFCYVDDTISISEKPLNAINGIQRVFKLKNDRTDVPDMYLGGGISKVRTISGTECWTLSSEKYIKSAVRNWRSPI